MPIVVDLVSEEGEVPGGSEPQVVVEFRLREQGSLAKADWPSNGVDDPGPNFVWTPDVAAKPLFPESGDYATQVKLTLVGGGAVVVTFETSVK